MGNGGQITAGARQSPASRAGMYAWPFAGDHPATFFADHLRQFASR